MLYQFNKKNKNLSELLTLHERVTSGLFVDKIFYYLNRAGKLHFSFLGKTFFFGNA